MPRNDFGSFHCSIARAVDVMGDTWTPLILRDLFLGIDTFDELVRDLGISRALLSTRLDRLVDGGVVEAVAYVEHPVRSRYVLTDAGQELVPVLVALAQWGDRWRSPDGPPMLFEHNCGSELYTRVTCLTCGGEVASDSITPLPGPGGRHAPGTAVVAERFAARMRERTGVEG